MVLWILGGAEFATGEVDSADTGEADIRFAPSKARNRKALVFMTRFKQIRFQSRRFLEPPKSEACPTFIAECSNNRLVMVSGNWQSRNFDCGLITKLSNGLVVPRQSSITYRRIPELTEWHESCTRVLARSWKKTGSRLSIQVFFKSLRDFRENSFQAVCTFVICDRCSDSLSSSRHARNGGGARDGEHRFTCVHAELCGSGRHCTPGFAWTTH